MSRKVDQAAGTAKELMENAAEKIDQKVSRYDVACQGIRLQATPAKETHDTVFLDDDDDSFTETLCARS